ncbi:hypothetical protein AC01_0475 [Escherichia coli 1-392-07_S3_C1]|mgnify:CR=1 FL=1|uniref:hypothetical protein n=1 Tax=Escherichia coli TaxID=562 RepID=UPI00044D5737|nr:hypothetical protein [Escherichia coli]EIH9536976.1 hypothetical protein [Escherichia coli]EZJ65838.1 hypothetical protein AC57_4345 [Escherichia coli 1-392-07_S3_C3]KDT36779.1 hypothetical protein AB17_0953 [Escherichia coli 3-105-05_S1_C1]KDU58347.1 hypothetical protein AD18_1088 [Escherichia coli 3-475-03_S4_C2]KDW62759.1 hypothetical protein AC29_0473 [Escherichia coli 1-392-07_S3_C2]
MKEDELNFTEVKIEIIKCILPKAFEILNTEKKWENEIEMCEHVINIADCMIAHIIQSPS